MTWKAFTVLAFIRLAACTIYDLNTTVTEAKAILSSTNFNYIVVGGGNAALPLARQLSDNPKNRVLVLEAGRSGANDPFVAIPANNVRLIGSDIDWNYHTSAQAHANNRTQTLYSGKALGGGSTINALIWSYGNKEEHDAYEELGSDGWNWDNFFETIKNVEAFTPPSQDAQDYGYYTDPSSLGVSGPVSVSFPEFLPIANQRFVQASIQLGHPLNKDAYGGNNAGVSYSLSSQTPRGVRETSEFAYADPVLSRENLVILYHALVTNLSISGPYHTVSADSIDKVMAYGVQIRFPDGSTQLAKVDTSKGEVILSAGVVRTPQLLELSGIGNKNVLSKAGIPQLLDLPGVGENYEDHLMNILTYELKEPYLSFDALQYNSTLLQEQIGLYFQGKGWLTFANSVPNMAPIQAILTTSELDEARTILEKKPPTISEELFNSVKERIFSGVPQVEFMVYNRFSAGNFSEKLANRSYVSIGVVLMHPLSRGSIHVDSNSIDDIPVINPNTLESEWDEWLLAKASAYARKFFDTPALKEIIEKEVFPGESVSSHDQWVQFTRASCAIGIHSVGTASLLPQKNNGVVDSQLKVYGTTNIRVADNSIWPVLISGHTQALAYAVGERAGALILN